MASAPAAPAPVVFNMKAARPAGHGSGPDPGGPLPHSQLAMSPRGNVQARASAAHRSQEQARATPKSSRLVAKP